MLKSRIGRFLGTHTAYAATTVEYVPMGVNQGNLVAVRGTSPHNLTAGTDTITVTLPSGVDPDVMPIDGLIPTYTPPASGTSWAVSGYLQVTAHDCSTGITTLKSVNITGAPVDSTLSGDVFLIRYQGMNISSTVA